MKKLAMAVAAATALSAPIPAQRQTVTFANCSISAEFIDVVMWNGSPMLVTFTIAGKPISATFTAPSAGHAGAFLTAGPVYAEDPGCGGGFGYGMFLSQYICNSITVPSAGPVYLPTMPYSPACSTLPQRMAWQWGYSAQIAQFGQVYWMTGYKDLPFACPGHTSPQILAIGWGITGN